jgi:hypothetical protein
MVISLPYRKGLAQNTNNRYITITYPFHPLAGRCFAPEKFNSGPPATFSIQFLERQLLVPAWMTESPASLLGLSDTPLVDARTLLDIADIVKGTCVPPGSASGILHSDTNQVEDLEHGKAKATSPSFPSSSGRRTPGLSPGNGDRNPGRNGRPVAGRQRRRRRKGGRE